jgi:hypothetical protein
MLLLGIILAPPFTGSKNEPVAHVGDFAGPAAVMVREALPAAKAVDDGFDLQELAL